MSEREWKPGDVALRTSKNDSGSLAVCVVGPCHANRNAHWHTIHPDSRTDWDMLAYDGVSYRPLVVIDPESREQVEQLADALIHARTGHQHGNAYPGEIDHVQAALREFANPTPPRPEEPTGLGAVVEDAEGYKYVRTHDRDDITYSWTVIDEAANKPYRMWQWKDISAVRTLSEGVTS